ncbi:pulmonary surfactant-associated protein D-like [Branchiostoma floridae]|uniref:Pulmonary surfactant-associated protein D-like n=1 Tax=Branchiostoma floridae TaxID=7739 RepID=A0A9J7KL45_BRAFL|nr:pulmonary surfactant-associated protein D-like [Branchiostoma floridae]
MGASMASVQSSQEQAFIDQIVPSNTPVLLGMTCDKITGNGDDSGCGWEGDEPVTYANWRSGEPTFTGKKKKRYTVTRNGEWYTVGENDKHYVVCERPDLDSTTQTAINTLVPKVDPTPPGGASDHSGSEESNSTSAGSGSDKAKKSKKSSSEEVSAASGK